MSSESDLIAKLREVAAHPAARGLLDDAAVLAPPLGRDLVLTHDMLVEGVHYLADDPPGDVAWKLLAVNLSDLAGKGAAPVGALMGFTLSGDEAGWGAAFVEGLGRALRHFNLPLLGGDTVSSPGPRVLGLTAIGQVPAGGAPSRTGVRPGDDLWVSGHIGDAGLGLRIALGEIKGGRSLLKRYRLPMPRLEAGERLAPLVHAMMDISDGLLIDAHRMAGASGTALSIDLGAVPLSADHIAAAGEDGRARLAAVVAGDDYELLFSADPSCRPAINKASKALGLPLTLIGAASAGSGISLSENGRIIDLPVKLGWEHEARR